MGLLRHASKSTLGPIKMARQQFQGLPSLLRFSSHRLFRTEAPQPIQEAATADPFLPSPRPPSGVKYARFPGTTRHTSKTDVLNMFAGCNLSIDDVKLAYDPSYLPLPALLRFPSRQAYDAGLKAIARSGRGRLESDDGFQWDSIAPYDGKAILVQGLPPNASQEDVERFLSGCTFDASRIQIFSRTLLSGSRIRMAHVRFPSRTLAMHAFITKNRGFCLNYRVTVRVLH